MVYGSVLALVMIVGTVGGVLSAWKFLKRIMSQAEVSCNQQHINQILLHAQSQKDTILQAAKQAAQTQYATKASELDAERELVVSLQEQDDAALSLKQGELDRRSNTLDLRLQELETVQTELEHKSQEITQTNQEILNQHSLLHASWEERALTKKENLFSHIREEWLAAEQLGISKWMMDQQESLKSQAQQWAQRVCDVVNFRYQPVFIWPKTSFSLSIDDFKWYQKHILEEGAPIAQLLLQDTDCVLSLLEAPSTETEPQRFIKIAGGLGVDKESIRMTLQEARERHVSAPDRIRIIMDKNKKYLDRLILKMGEDAIRALHLKPNAMNPALLRLIGSLNYRTSHRQNQYFHSLEVAQLAVLIATELGVDRQVVKRAGILHDIGKVLDYKIEGSHAVISGDYAAQLGESADVVDTVLAHHDDKVVETAAAYILKAADALSGARPGARVDMEEGYLRRIDGISGVINSFEGVTGSAIMHAGREVHVFVDSHKMKGPQLDDLAKNIVEQLEKNVEYPGQIRVTVIRRTEAVEVVA